MEYVGKKVLGEFLKDYVWKSKVQPVEALNKFSACKIDNPFSDDSIKGEVESEAEPSTVMQSLQDSQVLFLCIIVNFFVKVRKKQNFILLTKVC